MCTYDTQCIALEGCSGKGPGGWSSLTRATVYYDHPVHAPAEHTINIDFLSALDGTVMRLAVELTPAAARRLADAVLRAAEVAEAG